MDDVVAHDGILRTCASADAGEVASVRPDGEHAVASADSRRREEEAGTIGRPLGLVVDTVLDVSQAAASE
jgi:hypothetical protein